MGQVINSIHDRLSDIRENMVKKSEMKVMMTSILEVMKKDERRNYNGH